MGIITSQKITDYYERYKSIEVTFTKEILQVTGMITQQVYLKCVSDFWPCVVFSSSFQGAKVVVNIKSGIIEKLQQANNSASLRFCFKTPDADAPVTFFVSARSMGYAPYGDSKDVAIFTLQFTQRPPDDLIEIMGRLLDANVNSSRRREERIVLGSDSIRRLKLLSKETATFIQGVPRRCILRDISFSGAKVIMMGVAKFLVDRDSALRIDFDDPRESFLIKGKFINSESVEGRKELLVLSMSFNEAMVPMGYKIRLNDYLSQVRADNRGGDMPAPNTRTVKAPEEGLLQSEPASTPAAGASAGPAEAEISSKVIAKETVESAVPEEK